MLKEIRKLAAVQDWNLVSLRGKPMLFTNPFVH
jgi:hypothetical protein